MAHSKAWFTVLAAAVVSIAAGVTWYFASPVWTLHQIKAAADENDADALNSYIDYPALREDLKAEIVAQMMTEARKDKSGFGGVGLVIGTAMVGPVIDGLVSPAGMRAALKAKRDEAHSKRAAKAASALQIPQNPLIVRRSFSEFLVATKQHPTSGLVFERHGLSWKLSGVDLAPGSSWRGRSA